MKQAVILTALLSLGAAGLLLYFGGQNMPIHIVWMYVALAVISVLAAITYTVGKKAYGYYGMGDLMVLFFFGGVSVLGVYSLYTKSFSWENIQLALFCGLLSTSVLNLNNMRDYKNDAQSGKNTLVVKMGPNNAKFYHTLIIVLGLGSLVLFIDRLSSPVLFLSLIPAALLLLHVYRVMKITHPKDFDPELKKVAFSTFAISLLFTIGLILV